MVRSNPCVAVLSFLVLAPLWAACDPEALEDREFMVVEPIATGTGTGDEGGSESGDTGDPADEASEEHTYEGEPRICEAPAPAIAFSVEPTIDEFAAALDPAAGSTDRECGWSAVFTATYTDYKCEKLWNNNWKLECSYDCRCKTDYKSPCNPPWTTCGKRHDVNEEIGQVYGYEFMLGEFQCQLHAPFKCRDMLQDALKLCASICKKDHIPKRTRDCPDC